MNPKTRTDGKQTLGRAFDELEAELPKRIGRGLRWLCSPRARWIRLPLGLLMMAASLFWFLPFVGVEWLPLGLLLIALDVPPLQRPVGMVMLWLLAQWRKLRSYVRSRRAKRSAGGCER